MAHSGALSCNLHDLYEKTMLSLKPLLEGSRGLLESRAGDGLQGY